MTAGELPQPAEDEDTELNPNRPLSPPIKPKVDVIAPTVATLFGGRGNRSARKRPRTSMSPSSAAPNNPKGSSAVLPPHPPYSDNYTSEGVCSTPVKGLGLTRPRSNKSARPKTGSFRPTQLPFLGGGGDGGGAGGDKAWKPGTSSGGSRSGSDDNASAQLSKSAKVLEEDRKKVASIRSFLLNFLEERGCSIKKRLDLYVHQTETGRPVTDAVVQEVCKLRPDMVGLSLRDCIEVTDVGLWCIARHTKALRELNVSGCHGVTNIGLRSLAICCDKMELLDFTNCTRLTDLGLRVLGGGCWSLKSLSLEGCSHVSDTGVAELAQMSTGLTYLNISRCERVGEYGDRALIQLGRSCHQLKGLDAFGCSHAQDPGLLSVARGCPKLEKLMLTGCGGITGKSIRALARGCSALRDLSISGCGGVGNGDLKELAKGCKRLRHLNIAECAQVNAHGLGALAAGLKNLTELDVGGCERVDDSALRALCSMNAHFLNLSGCAAITEIGVAGIAMNCTALSSLNVTGCPGIGRRFMAELCHSMKLSEPAQEYFGFQPRKNAKELLAKKEARIRRRIAAIMVQAQVRGRLARGRANIVKRNWVIKTCLASAQAIIRGYFARKWYRAWRAQVREQRAAAAIQATWRMLGDCRTAERLRREKMFREKGQSLATKIQAAWWGHRGRVRMLEIRAIRARRLLLEARTQARRELAAIMIQSNLRRLFAQSQLLGLKKLRDEALAQERRIQAAAVLIQSVARMREGRVALAMLKARRDQKILEWEMALKVQAAWRGRIAKMLVLSMQILREQARQKAAAITIQSFWRAVRARHLTAIQRALFKIRQIQGGASKEIQRVYRGFKGRLRAKARRRVFESDLGREAAAMAIERVFRGHKGRERFECKQHLRSLEHKARPLLAKLDELTENAVKLSDRMCSVGEAAEPLRAEHTILREELFHIHHTTDKYTDSDKVNGCRQRFLTKFLQVRLVELKKTLESRLEKLDAEAIEIEVKVRYNTRILRQTERELIPLGKGTVEKVKLLRTARLRKKVRSEKSGAITIQRIYRGWRVRAAINSWYRDYWVESEDEATGDVYYVNTWNQEIRWIKPLEISLFESRGSATNKSVTGNFSRLSGGNDDDNDDGGGVASISDRFRQRLVELTGEATLAAEEEEKFLRYVAANIATITAAAYNDVETDNSSSGYRVEADADGTDKALAFAAAREWTFVGTDKRLLSSPGAATKHKCWYHAGTSEYFWGDNPPLLGLLLHCGDGASQKESNARPPIGSDGRGGSDHSFGDSGGVVGEVVGGDLLAAGATGTLHPVLGLIFSDRASGEAWLKTQDLGPLLANSVRVCDIGPAGWCQLRAAVPSHCTCAGGRGNCDCPVYAAGCTGPATMSTVTEDSAAVLAAGRSRSGIGIRGVGSNSSGECENDEPGRDDRMAKTATTTAAAAAAKVGERESTAVIAVDGNPTTLPDDGDSSVSLTFFTFFHHAETGGVRWCLSPRSALLATPRTSRREASCARQLSAAAAYEHVERHQEHGSGWDGPERTENELDQPGGVAPDGGKVALADDTSGDLSGNGRDDWEVVEDGDMVFYYNKRLGVSTWEPPPGWGTSDTQESYGAGG